MKLSIDRLDTTPSEHRYPGSAEWWAEWDAASSVERPDLVSGPDFVVVAQRSGDEVTLAGRVTAELELECSRCLKRYRHALSDTFQLVLEPIGDRRPADPEGEESLARYGMCLSDELEVGWYRGTEVSLDPYFAEVMALAMPVQPLCDEECAGLCPHCGIDRNEASCDCTDEKPDSPFAALAALRGGSDGSI
jgi:uncharacterized protein